ncbi:hypothetical protein [Thalassolituus sp.]|jgi:hypothetical protein|uniref:hypothetical protein n=1 Tax=Thalassolituus sp. TaxID=2030822 RepID=UPI0032D902F9
MGLVGDLQEVRSLWADTSWKLRIVLVVSTFFAISSVASLSDLVFQWRGFILDGIQFYSNWITDPIRRFLAQLGLILSGNSVDFLILSTLYISGLLRKFWLDGAKTNILHAIFLAVLLCLLAVRLSGQASGPSIWGFLLITVTYLLTPIAWKETTKEKFVYYAPISIAILVVLVLGAINSGLTRPLV